MKKRLLLLILFIIFVVSFTTFILVLFYVDPYEYTAIGLFALIFTFIVSFTSILTLIIYFIKKIYFRGSVTTKHVMNSFRQSFLISIFFLILIFFNYYNAPLILTSVLAFIVLFCLELFVKTQD